MDDSTSNVSRRRVLRAVSAASVAGIAGCGDLGGEEGDSTEAEPTEPTATETETANEVPTTEETVTEAETETETETEFESETETETETEEVTEEETPDPPNVEKQTIQRDKAAITHIQRETSGTIAWPSYRWVDPVDPSLLGSWERGDVVFDFAADGVVEFEGPDSSFTGQWATRDALLYMRFESGESLEYRYEIVDGDRGPVLELFQGGELVNRFQRTNEGSDDRGVVRRVRDLAPVREQGTNATTKRRSLRVAGSGSGFVVSSDGYIVTNAHVVGEHVPPDQEMFQQLARERRRALREELAADRNLSNQQKRQIEETLFQKIMGYYGDHAQVETVSRQISVLNGRATPDDDVAVESWPADVLKVGTAYTEVGGETTIDRDVAILSVDRDDLPTVTLGDGESVETGDKIFVIGYPALGIDEYFDDRNTTLEPTLTTGIVSQRRTLNSGIEAIQTDAAINGGNSGGPMYNDRGEVVGIATFSPTDTAIQEIQFGLPIEVAKAFMDDLGVENDAGEMDVTFEEGLEAYWRGDCETATAKMERVLELYPEHPYAGEYITDCENGDAPGQ